MKKLAKQIRMWLKHEGFNHAQVKLNKNVLIIENVGLNNAANIASMATGLKFEYMTESMTKID